MPGCPGPEPELSDPDPEPESTVDETAPVLLLLDSKGERCRRFAPVDITTDFRMACRCEDCTWQKTIALVRAQ